MDPLALNPLTQVDEHSLDSVASEESGKMVAPPYRWHVRPLTPPGAAETDENKRRLLRTFALHAAQLHNHHGKSALRWKTTDDVSDVVLALFGAVTVSAIVLNYIHGDAAVQVVSAVCASIATVGQAVKKGLGVTTRWIRRQETANKYEDLAREITVNLTKRRLDSHELSYMLSDVDERLALLAPHNPSAATFPLLFMPARSVGRAPVEVKQ